MPWDPFHSSCQPHRESSGCAAALSKRKGSNSQHINIRWLLQVQVQCLSTSLSQCKQARPYGSGQGQLLSTIGHTTVSPDTRCGHDGGDRSVVGTTNKDTPNMSESNNHRGKRDWTSHYIFVAIILPSFLSQLVFESLQNPLAVCLAHEWWLNFDATPNQMNWVGIKLVGIKANGSGS